LVAGATGAAAVWAAPKLGWSTPAGALEAVSFSADPTAAFGELPFADDFDQEFPGGLLTRWNMARPVQLAGTTQFGTPCPANGGLDNTDFLAGHGIVVAMDGMFGGSTGPGRIESAQTFAFHDGLYNLSFQVAGSHRRADPIPATLIASMPGCDATMTVVMVASDGFVRFTLPFLVTFATVSTIVFESGDAPGQAGLLLDDVSLTRGPFPHAS
jgi:hypothetical protein